VYKHNNSFLNKRLPFGGVGHSGIGAYHGALSFDTFHIKVNSKKKQIGWTCRCDMLLIKTS
jgi:acyl-CoA reductase-like NAD-dependent aldehyde dehydrogenase